MLSIYAEHFSTESVQLAAKDVAILLNKAEEL